MIAIRTVLRELFGLFVDDGSLALAIVAWVVMVAALLRVGLPPLLGALLLCIGLAALLVENIRRSARRAAGRPRMAATP